MVTRANFEWNMVNLIKQFEVQNSIWGNSNFWIGADQNFQNYFWFYITTWKTPNMKVVQLFELYNFHVGHFSKFQMDFKLEVQIGKGDTFWKSVFSKLLWILYWNFKNSKHQSCTSWQDLQLFFWTQPQILLSFWITPKGAVLGFKIRVFPPLALRKSFTLGF